MPVNIRGKEYATVAERLAQLHDDHPDWAVTTEILHRDEEVVVIKATITDKDGRILATGHAEEVRASSNINRTSAIENCETSACGRACAIVGYAGSDIRSADEMESAINSQAAADHIEYMALVRECFDAVVQVKTHLQNDEIDDARAAFKELDVETQKALWKAPTKGGIFTTEERAKLKGTA